MRAHDRSDGGANRRASTSAAVAVAAFVAVVAFLAASGASTSRAATSWRSALYPSDWAPGFAGPQGDVLPDVSYAGYRGGTEPPIVDDAARPGGRIDAVAEHGADPTGAADATAAIQAAIDQAAVAGGAVVFLPAGSYRIDGHLRIRSSGIVLRGAGIGMTTLVGTKSSGMTDRATIECGGTLSIASSPESQLVQDGVAGSFEVRVADASLLTPGDDVSLGWTITDAFVAEHAMTGTWVTFNGLWKPFFRRNVVAVDTSSSPHVVTLDVPIRYPAKLRDGASLRRESGHMRECGIESLSITNAVSRAAAWSSDRAHAISVDGGADCWVRDVASAAPPSTPEGDHLQSGGVLVVNCKRVSVVRCRMERAQNRGSGGNGYLFEVSRSSEVLFRDCESADGRHNYIQNWDFGTSGCVFLRCASRGSRSFFADWDPIGLPAYSEYHHSLATANLVDSCVLEDGWSAGNRGSESSGAGHSATGCVFWNVTGGGLLRSHQFGRGFVIGPGSMTVQTTSPLPIATGTAPEDLVERGPVGAVLEPSSLYEDQRRRRMRTPLVVSLGGRIADDVRSGRDTLRIDARLAPPVPFDPVSAAFSFDASTSQSVAQLSVAPADPAWRRKRGGWRWIGTGAGGSVWRVEVGEGGSRLRAAVRRIDLEMPETDEALRLSLVLSAGAHTASDLRDWTTRSSSVRRTVFETGTRR